MVNWMGAPVCLHSNRIDSQNPPRLAEFKNLHNTMIKLCYGTFPEATVRRQMRHIRPALFFIKKFLNIWVKPSCCVDDKM